MTNTHKKSPKKLYPINRYKNGSLNKKQTVEENKKRERKKCDVFQQNTARARIAVSGGIFRDDSCAGVQDSDERNAL